MIKIIMWYKLSRRENKTIKKLKRYVRGKYKPTNNLSMIIEREMKSERKCTARERSGSKRKSKSIEKSWKESKGISSTTILLLSTFIIETSIPVPAHSPMPTKNTKDYPAQPLVPANNNSENSLN